MKQISCIYAITNLVNGKRYIGSTNDFHRRKRFHQYRLRSGSHQNAHLQSAWDKYGEDAFRFCIVSKIDVDGDLLKSEQAWLDSYLPEYNILKIAGSGLGLRHTPEAIEKIKSARSRQKICHSEETKAKLRISNPKGRPGYFKGLKHSEDSKIKIGQASRRRVFTPEIRKNISIATTKMWASGKRKRAGE